MKTKKLLSFVLMSLFLFSSCKSENKNVSMEKLMNKQFISFDNGSISFSLNNGADPKVNIRYPDFCWNKSSGLLIDKDGKVFKKLNKENAKLEAFNPKIENKNGKNYINTDSKAYPNDRFLLKDEFTIKDTVLNIEYIDTKSKYKVSRDENEYPSEYKEIKEILKSYTDTLNALKKNKDGFSKEVKEAIEREINLEK